MEEIGTVKEVNGPKALVSVQKQGGGCESCPGNSLCKSVGAESLIEAVNEANAQSGDRVRVSFRPYTYLKGAVMVYGIPALMLIVGAVAGKDYVSGMFPGADPDMVSAACAFGLFAASFLLLKLWSKRFESKKEYMPVIEEILSPKN